MSAREWLAAALCAAMLVVGRGPGAFAADANSPSDDELAKAQKAVTDDLDKYKAAGFVLQPVKDEAVGRAFPKYVFFGVFFRQYPVARLTPEGLSASNLYAVGADGKPQLMKDSKQLQEFFKTNLPPAKEDAAAKDAARAYVRLMEELHQDGFFKFALQDDSTKVEQGKEGKTASARAVVMAGGNGELGASLRFGAVGALDEVTEKVDLKEGPRPICQATKLLDADPVVRRMAEQDLLIMGRAARSYLDEQRARAAPELQGAIDRIWRRILIEDR